MEKRASEALQDKIGEAVACRKIGECYCLLGHFDKALKLQNQYLALAQECNDLVSCPSSGAVYVWVHKTDQFCLSQYLAVVLEPRCSRIWIILNRF